jgi:transcriptional regulator PpsR
MKSSSTDKDLPFVTFRKMVEALGSAAVSELLGRATDLVLALDAEGVVRDVIAKGERGDPASWPGRQFEATSSVETTRKAALLIAQARASGAAGPRHINHPVRGGEDLPISYTAHRIDDAGAMILFGRDLTEMSGLQVRLLDVQRGMEQEYQRLRQMEARYRLLFQSSAEAVAMVDVASGKVTEANPAAGEMFRRNAGRLAGARFAKLFESEDIATVDTALSAAVSGEPQKMLIRPLGASDPVEFVATAFRADDEALLLVRATQPSRAEADTRGVDGALLRLMRDTPDGFVLTDGDGCIRWVNEAFLAMVGPVAPDRVSGGALEDFLGRSGVEIGVLLDSIRCKRRVRQFSTVVRGVHGDSTAVEASATAVSGEHGAGFGFVIRNVALRQMSASKTGPERNSEQLAALVGTAPLKELVRESSDLIEKMCIEAALVMTKDNRAAAAELLGLSRQSLYSKMHRYGIGGLSGS